MRHQKVLIQTKMSNIPYIIQKLFENKPIYYALRILNQTIQDLIVGYIIIVLDNICLSFSFALLIDGTIVKHLIRKNIILLLLMPFEITIGTQVLRSCKALRVIYQVKLYFIWLISFFYKAFTTYLFIYKFITIKNMSFSYI